MLFPDLKNPFWQAEQSFGPKLQVLQPVTWQARHLEELVEETTNPLIQVEHALLLDERQVWQNGTKQIETHSPLLIEYPVRQLVQIFIPAEQFEQNVTLQRAQAPFIGLGLKGFWHVAQKFEALQV